MQLSRWGFLYIHLLIQFHFRTSFSLSRVRWEATSFLSRFLTPNFNPPIPCGMGHMSHFQSDMMAIFQFTHPVWDGTRLAAVFGNVQGYFNPPIPCGMGLSTTKSKRSTTTFQSTHPVWDGTVSAIHHTPIAAFQSTHPVWDGTSLIRGS